MNISTPYAKLVEAIQIGDVEAGVAEAQHLISTGVNLKDIFVEAITPCLKDIGDRFSRLELFLPDMMRAAEVVKAIHAALADTLKDGATLEKAGRIVIGTVYGDIHDIGKNIVATMLEVNGFEVFDIGVNVEAFEFIERARAANADIIALSSLMSTSLPYVSDTVSMIRENPADAARFKVLIGGGPVTAEYAAQVGADAYGEDAADAVRQALALMQRK